MKNRINVHVSQIGSVTVDFFFYKKWQFFVGADYADSVESVIEYIAKTYIYERRLRRGFRKYRDEIAERIEEEMNGGGENES